ncbi:hypothetical protein BsWGS_20654 [Bradybaena similaris]
MKCLRKAVNVTRRDRMRNDDNRKKVKTPPCMDYIERQKIRWFGHLMRMDPATPPLLAYTSRRSGYGAKGRPRKRCTDNIAETLRKYGLTMTDATQKAKDRKLQLPTTLHGTSGIVVFCLSILVDHHTGLE